MTELKAADHVARFLADRGVRTVFEVIGGMTTHLIDAIHRQDAIRIVSTRHEQAAAFAADGSARVSGVPGVALATSGPGATNLLTGIGSCFFDSVPAVFITGQVNSYELRGERAVRQLGFQETDIVSMATPITKAAWQVQSAADLSDVLPRAFDVAESGRPGPVLVDITMDAQRTPSAAWTSPHRDQALNGQPDVQRLLHALARAERPLILAGGGVRASRTAGDLRAFAERHGVPVVYSLMAVDAMPFDHPMRVGMIGSYGNRWANLAIARSDFLLVLGSRLDIRQTGARTDAFKADRTVFHVDVDVGEINNRVAGCEPVVTDLRSFFAAASGQSRSAVSRGPWLEELRHLRQQWPDTEELRGAAGINPNSLMHTLSAASDKACAFVADVGQHQMWAAQSLELGADQRFLTSGGMGAMGYSIPAAIGAATASSGPVVVIAGDGGAQVNIQELQTVAQHRLPLKIVILNNQCHGMVRQFQKSYFGERYPGTMWGYSAPNFASIASAYAIPARTVDSADDIAAGMRELWKAPDEPFLLQVMIDSLTDVYPKLAFGRTIADMEPQVQPVDMEST